MRRIARSAVFMWLLLLLASVAGADSISFITGNAALDQSSPRVWRHGTAVPSTTGALVSSTSHYTLLTKSVVYGCDPTCANLHPILQIDPSTDGVLTSNNSLFTLSALMGFNGTTLDRIRAGMGDGIAATGLLAQEPMLFNGANFDRARTVTGTADTTTGLGVASVGPMLFNGTTWDRMRSGAIGDVGTTIGMPASLTYGVTPAVEPGTGGVVRLRTAGAAALTYTVGGAGALVTVPYSTWSITNTPAANTQATTSRAAGAAGVRHVATSIHACFAATVTAAPATVNVRDGATGAGTVLWSGFLGVPTANEAECINVSGLSIIGTAATAMTIEFAAAGGASTNQTVTLTGFSTQ